MKGDKFRSRRKGGAILEDPGEEWAWLPRHQAADHAPRVVGEGEAGGKGAQQLRPVRIRAQHSTWATAAVVHSIQYHSWCAAQHVCTGAVQSTSAHQLYRAKQHLTALYECLH